MSSWKEKIMTGGSLLRFIRLGLSALMLHEAYKEASLLPAVIGGVLLWQSISNVGCCGAAGCDTDHSAGRSSSSENGAEIRNFEELKQEAHGTE